MPRNIYRILTDMPNSKHHTRYSYSLESSCNWAVKLCASAKGCAHLLSYSQAGKGGKCRLCPPHTGLLLISKISPTDKVAQAWQTQGLVLDTGNSVSIQNDAEMVVITGEILDTQLFSPSSEEKTRCLLEYAKVRFGLQTTSLTAPV